MPTGGEAADYQPVQDLIELPVNSPKAMPADKGYDSDDVRSALSFLSFLNIAAAKIWLPSFVNRI